MSEAHARYMRQASMPEWIRSDPRSKPYASEPGQLRTPAEVKAEDHIRNGSEELLRALWWRHPGIVADFVRRQVERRA